MAIATAPLKLSAESTIETTIELRWSAPESDGGDTITGYFIERSLNGAAFTTLVANTGNDDTFFSSCIAVCDPFLLISGGNEKFWVFSDAEN